MITVRFPSGHFVTYNDAHYVIWEADRAKLMKTARGPLVASVLLSSGAIIEIVPPCKTGDASKGFGASEAAAMLMEQATLLSGGELRNLKRLLARYNPHTGIWKDKL